MCIQYIKTEEADMLVAPPFISLAILNQLEKLEAAKAAYLWLPSDTFGYLSLPFLTCPYLSLPVLTCPYLSLPFLTFPYLS